MLPLWLQFTLGYSALQSGLALLPIAAGSLFASGASFGLVAKLSPLSLVRTGLALEAAGPAGLGLIATTNTRWWTILRQGPTKLPGLPLPRRPGPSGPAASST